MLIVAAEALIVSALSPASIEVTIDVAGAGVNYADVIVRMGLYSSALASADGVSINLSPDGNPTGSFVKHSAVSSLSRSAGTRVDVGAR